MTTVGIMGCDSGCGATHLSLALSSYCSSKLRQKTAYLELHDRNEIVGLLSKGARASWEKRDFDMNAFSFHGVDYYPSLRGEDVPALMNQGYSYLVMDLGHLSEADTSEFLRCDRKVALLSLSPWKSEKAAQFFEQFDSINLGDGFDFLVQTGTPKAISEFSRSRQISARQLPFIKDPFRIEKESFQFLQELLAQ